MVGRTESTVAIGGDALIATESALIATEGALTAVEETCLIRSEALRNKDAYVDYIFSLKNPKEELITKMFIEPV